MAVAGSAPTRSARSAAEPSTTVELVVPVMLRAMTPPARSASLSSRDQAADDGDHTGRQYERRDRGYPRAPGRPTGVASRPRTPPAPEAASTWLSPPLLVSRSGIGCLLAPWLGIAGARPSRPASRCALWSPPRSADRARPCPTWATGRIHGWPATPAPRGSHGWQGYRSGIAACSAARPIWAIWRR